MKKKRKKRASFDAMMKLFIQNYDIPSRKDIDKLTAKLDRIEKVIKKSAQMVSRNTQRGPGGRPPGGYGMTASDTVLGIVKASKKGIDFAGIQAKSAFNEKKLRNIIYRLSKLGTIKRKSRGIYIVP